ncbi:MAG: zf-HC2 domain-containing protein [Planctomycetes bacterium]|nr:zf-HC2 domain-containing protein [Planctomycetota bacterium]
MTTFNCNEIREEFAALDRGECTLSTEQAVQAHLDACAACREMRALDARIDHLFQSEEIMLAAPGFEESVRAAVQSQHSARRHLRILSLQGRSWRMYGGAAALAAAGVLVAVGIVKFALPSGDDDNDVIEHLDVVETLALIRDAIPSGEATVDFTIMNNSTLETFLKAQNEEGN